jgi:hypothetical protein
MEDGLGSVDYAYDSLSRLTSETRNITELSASYTLNYAYNLGNALTSLSIPFRSRQIGYTYDTAGRLSGVTASGFSATYFAWPNQYTQTLASFASNITYRAWGARKSMTYGNTTSEQTTYNARLKPATFTLNNMNYQNTNVCCSYPTYSTMTWSYGYYDDGTLEHAWDSTNEWFDRAYKYDHVGRLKEASTFRRARGLSPYPAINSPDPYFQTITYDAFNHSNRTGKLYAGELSDIGTYINNRRQDSRWEYDADGNVTSDASYQQTIDASGTVIHSVSKAMVGDGVQYPLQPRLDITQTYDGAGAPAKRVQISRTLDLDDVPREDTQTTYYIKSSVLGGATVAEIGGSDTIHIYANGQRIAREFEGNVTFEHHNPVTGSWITSHGHSTYRTTAREERDPAGAEMPLANPLAYAQSYVDWKFSSPLFIEGGDPFDYVSGYTRDGLPMTRSEVERILGRLGPARFLVLAERYKIPKVAYFAFLEGEWDLSQSKDGVIGEFVGQAAFYAGNSPRRQPQGKNPQQPVSETPLNPDGLRADIQRVLNGRKDCADFVKGLLFTVAQYTQLPLYSLGFLDNPSRIVDAVASQLGYFLARGQGVSGYAKGGLKLGTAKITIDISMGDDVGATIGRGLLLIHENAHEAGAEGYLDRELAIAAYQTAWAQGYQNIPNPPTTNDVSRNSQYLSDLIFQACHPKQGKRFPK